MANREIGAVAVGAMCLGMVQTNCYFVYKEDGKNHKADEGRDSEDDFTEVVVFDPADRGDIIFGELHKRGFKVAAIYLTHAHFDHFAGADELRKLSGAKLYVSEKDERLCGDPNDNLSIPFMGVSLTIKPDGVLRDGDICEAAGLKFKMIETPGHTVGSCCYYFEEAGILMSGDTLFEESVGRTDFPGGSAKTLYDSCHDKLLVLPDDTLVYSGHGGETTIGHEKMYNSFL